MLIVSQIASRPCQPLTISPAKGSSKPPCGASANQRMMSAPVGISLGKCLAGSLLDPFTRW